METPEKNYKTQCRDLQVLHWESKLEPLPVEDPNFWTFDPQDGDLALVNNVEYVFNKGEWIEIVEDEEQN